jgi:alkyl sulfatase BDS1-like metallo-beta-lactamase superfamily hydrolase
MLPGHGFPVMGDDRIQLACDETAEVLEALHSQTVEWMNKGVRLDEIIHRVKAPQHLLDRPYLRPIYDEPEFIIRNIWRLYGGWYDGNPANLKPAPESELARELADAAGGAITLAKRAQELAKAGDLRLASHLAEFAAQADPQSAEVHNIRAEVYEKRALHEDSLMARGIFTWAAGESRSAANDPDR